MPVNQTKDELRKLEDAYGKLLFKYVERGKELRKLKALRGIEMRDRCMKAIGAAEELERFATAKDLKGMPGLIQWSMRHRAAQLRREAEGEKDGQK